MADTNQKVDVQTIENPFAPAQVVSTIDNPNTTSLKPAVLEVKTYANAKTNITIPERVVLALGGNSAFKTTVEGLDALAYQTGRALDKTTTDAGEAKIEPQLPGEYLTTTRGQTRGRPYRLQVKPYTWGKANFKWITFRAPSWVTILSIRWMFWEWLNTPETSIPGGAIWVGRRAYPLRQIQDSEFKTANLKS